MSIRPTIAIGCLAICPLFAWAAGIEPQVTTASSASTESIRFERKILTAEYHCDGVQAGDINKDGTVDVVAGPFWYEGPGFTIRHAFTTPSFHPHADSPSNSMFTYLHDFNHDGWVDILVLGRVHKHQAFWYENPKGTADGPWKKHFVFERVQGESPPFVDVDGDGQPELVALWQSQWGFIQPIKDQPYAEWQFRPITRPGEWNHFYHGTGIGDVNGDGRLDLVLNDGWWEQPADAGQKWIEHPHQFSKGGGGAQMFVYDVDGDGDNDVISALDGHGWGLAWFEHIHRGEHIDFVEHLIMGDQPLPNGEPAFSQAHALDLADINGDGLLDIVTGKRRWAHGPFKDDDPNADPVLYWFELTRQRHDATTRVQWKPHWIDRASGVGVQIQATDLTGDGKTDILAASKLGVFAFLQTDDKPTADRRPPRLLILTDIGGDPDDTQSLIRLMLWSNDFEIEGLIASASGTPGELDRAIVRPDLIREIVEAYGQVFENLRQHSPGYPDPKVLLDRIKAGNPNRGKKAVGQGHDTEGSNWIIRCVDREDDRPLNLAIWGGQTDLAQALWRVKQDRGEEGYNRFVSKLRIHDINDQDRIFDWMWEQFPNLFYVLDHAGDGKDKREGAYRGMYLGGDESTTSKQWVMDHIKRGHGPLGERYPMSTWTAPNPHGVLKEGDTPSWFYFLQNGLQDSEFPDRGGWGGRFHKSERGVWRDSRDTVNGQTSARTTVWRWRPAFQSEFAARMDWCVQPFDKANHPPVAVLLGDSTLRTLHRRVQTGQSLTLDATGSSDPDQHRLKYRWWIYAEAGTVDVKFLEIGSPDAPKTEIRISPEMPPGTAHVILEVTDDTTPSITRYRRLILDIQSKKK